MTKNPQLLAGSRSDARLFSIGHSNHSPNGFVELLKQHEIDVLVDVRSAPWSAYSSHFNREPLQEFLKRSGLMYLFLGEELGGRPPERDHYDDEGHVLYSRLAVNPRFLEGVDRVEKGIQKYRVALMCSEEDPSVCHRFLLIGRVLQERGQELLHIRGDGLLQTVADVDPSSRQKVLFPETEEARPWKSLRSVLPKAVPPSFLEDASHRPNFALIAGDRYSVVSTRPFDAVGGSRCLGGATAETRSGLSQCRLVAGLREP